jgi:hypothetical protein
MTARMKPDELQRRVDYFRQLARLAADTRTKTVALIIASEYEEEVDATASSRGPGGKEITPRPNEALLHTITESGRVFVALRKAGRVSPRRTPVYHAVTPFCRMALCASEPGASSRWAEPPAEHVTCPVCLGRLARLCKQRHRHNGIACYPCS